MADRTEQLIRQLSRQLANLEKENQSLKRQVVNLQIQLKRCMKIIEALLNQR
jgi:cell division protein FtsB